MWTVVAILVVLWLVGFLGFPTLGGGFIHILLVIAVIVLIVKLVQGRRAV
jgi:tryptophan-rich sensory protein